MMDDREKSDIVIVATKPTNKAGQSAAEPVEPRTGTERNAGERSTCRTQGRASVSQALDRVRQAVKQRKKEKFTSLFHHLSVDLLREAFFTLKRDAAPGVDGLTWAEYQVDLEPRLIDLHARLHRGAYRVQPSRRRMIPKPERCFLPIHVYDTERSRPVAVILRPGKTPSGVEIRGHFRRLVRLIRRHWPTTRITFRGDSHYACPEVMNWCETNGLSYIFGLAGTKPLGKKVEDEADAIRTERAIQDLDVVRGFAETKHWAGSWTRSRRVVARIEATRLGCDRRYVVTNIKIGTAEWLYDSLYCARGQAENLIKLHKSQLASDRTSCRSPLANQVRLVLHTAAYWLMLAIRDAIPKIQDLAKAEFTTLRLRLLKIVARITETKSRIRVAFATACPDAALFRGLVTALQRGGP